MLQYTYTTHSNTWLSWQGLLLLTNVTVYITVEYTLMIATLILQNLCVHISSVQKLLKYTQLPAGFAFTCYVLSFVSYSHLLFFIASVSLCKLCLITFCSTQRQI